MKISHKRFRNTLANVFAVCFIVALVSFIVLFALLVYESKYTDHFSSMYGETPDSLAITINVFVILAFTSMSACGIAKWLDRFVIKALREARR